MKSPIFILGSHKSGSSLLRSLLDGSPELFVIPFETHFFQLSGYWVDYSLRKNYPQKLNLDEIVANYANHIKLSNEKGGKTGDSDLMGKWNIDRFTDYMYKHSDFCYQNKDLNTFYKCYVSALHFSLFGFPPKRERFVDKSIENAEYAALLEKIFPDAKFIHIVRNPYSTLVSLRKHMTRDHYPFLGTAISALNNSFYHLYKNPLLINEYFTLRFEDLIENPQEQMKRIANFIDIEFSKVLLQPTRLNEPWRGNSTSGEKFDGISKKPMHNWKNYIYPLEIKFINRYFFHILRDFEYEMITEKKSVYYPMAGETVNTYLGNRILWKFTKVLPTPPVLT